MDSRWVTLGMTSIDSKSPLFSPFAIMSARVLPKCRRPCAVNSQALVCCKKCVQTAILSIRRVCPSVAAISMRRGPSSREATGARESAWRVSR